MATAANRNGLAGSAGWGGVAQVNADLEDQLQHAEDQWRACYQRVELLASRMDVALERVRELAAQEEAMLQWSRSVTMAAAAAGIALPAPPVAVATAAMNGTAGYPTAAGLPRAGASGGGGGGGMALEDGGPFRSTSVSPKLELTDDMDLLGSPSPAAGHGALYMPGGAGPATGFGGWAG